MDTLRGQIGSFDDDTRDEDYSADIDDGVDGDETGRDAPPSPVGQDERRMQVRAYNHWASLLADRNFPSIEDLDPEALPDFGPYSVLLDFTGGIESPAVQFLGTELAKECSTESLIRTLDDVPSRSLLSRITDHYMQILANQAPIGFEAEFVNQRNVTILYRGILLPFSSDDDTIDFIYGVINWKEVADQITSDELLLEIDQALEADDSIDAGEEVLAERTPDPVTDWADGPAAEPAPAAGEPLFADFASAAAHDAGGDADWGDDEYLDEDGQVTEFALPDIGDADEEDTINHDAYASLMPSGIAEDEEVGLGSLGGLGGMRPKPAKKPLDLTFGQSLTPLEAPDIAANVEYDDFPAPAFGQEDDRFASLLGSDAGDEHDEEDAEDWASPLDLAGDMEEAAATASAPQPEPFPAADVASDGDIGSEETGEPASVARAQVPVVEEPAIEEGATRVPEFSGFAPDDGDMGLYDTLAEARELAQIANSTEDRSRSALYEAVSRAYDVSLAAAESPTDFAELIAENGLSVQERAPMTPVVKLVFGADYDKTRLTEYAAVLSYAHRQGIERGKLKGFLAKADGGLKGIVQAERRLRREEEGKDVEPTDQLRSALAAKLRKLELHGFDAIDPEGPEFGVVVIRRLGNGEIAVIGDCSDDLALVEKVARKLVG